jgi:hypothetical protein
MLLNYNPPVGTKIEQACEEALKLAKASEATVVFHYNAVTVRANQNDTVDALVEKWTAEYNDIQNIYGPR